MSARLRFFALGFLFLFPTLAFAAERPVISDGVADVIAGGSLSASGAERDTLYLIGPWGSGALTNGQFETPDGAPAWNGFTHIDMTQLTESQWHADTYHAVSGFYSAWCGEMAYPACTAEDEDGGYGNRYDELLVWTEQVSDPLLATTLEVDALVSWDVEPGYDYVNLGCYKAGDDLAYLWTADGTAEAVPVSASVTWLPGEYVGEAENEVRLAWHVTSDGGWSDADCSYPSVGAMQVDDVTVTMTHDGAVTSTFDDFEDGTLGNWEIIFPPGVGDYAHIRGGLGDIDPCAVNLTPQVCFLADDMMLEERGLPTQTCINWCYGPSGYIVNTQGGAAGPDEHLYNQVWSPIFDWPAAYQGLSILFDVYCHEDLSADAPGIFYSWGIRSSANDDIYGGNYQDRSFIYYGEGYRRQGDPTGGSWLVADCKIMRFEFRAYELGYIWGWEGDDGYPAPYLDNVTLLAYSYDGPGMDAREIDLAQDAFPADGQLHTGADLGLNDVRFDLARNIAVASDLRNDPGDSLLVSIVAVRTGAELVTEDVDATVTAPRLYFTIRTNPLFDPYRLSVGPFTTDSDNPLSQLQGEILSHAGGVMSGYVQGAPARRDEYVYPDYYMFDLPDADFLYPGDVLHYYVEAWDSLEGVYRGAALPADRSGYGDFEHPLAYDPGFVVHALPTMHDPAGGQTAILFWNDEGNQGGRDEWWRAFGEMGFVPGLDVDVFYTNAASSGVGNGLGGRATVEQLVGYDVLVYTSGQLGSHTITPLDYDSDAGDDLGVLEGWFALGGRRAFLTGDDLVTDLQVYGEAGGRAFVTDRMGVAWQTGDARYLLGGDMTPNVTTVAGNPVFQRVDAWMAYGGCAWINTFDGVTAAPGDQLAVFNDDSTGLSAATRHVGADGSVVVSLPYDLRFIRMAPTAKMNQPASLSARTLVLMDVISSFGALPLEPVVGVPVPEAAFCVGAHPNPFNPLTNIEYDLPRSGHLTLKIFDVQGKLIRTLVDERVAAGPGHVTWDGTDAAGRGTASGLYFCEARAGQDVKVDKLMLLK